MIFNMTGGGVPDLAFQVLGGTTAPENPKENTIWVHTDQKITGYGFSSREPDGIGGWETAKGRVITLNDAASSVLRGLKLYGETTQDGTPRPENPVPLISVGDEGSVGVKFDGKNLMPKVGWALQNGSGFENAPGTNTTRVRSDSFAFGQKGTFVISGVPSGLTLIAVRKYDANKTLLTGGSISGMTFGDIPDGCAYIHILFGGTNLTEDTLTALNNANIQIERGITPTEYEPYKRTAATVSTPNGLPGIPVTSGGNYTDEDGQQWICDEVDFEKGVYVQRVIKVTAEDLSGGGYDKIGNVARTALTIKNKATAVPLGLSTHLPMVANYTMDSPHFYAQNSQLWVFVPVASLAEASINGIHQWIADNNAAFLYCLAEEKHISLTAEELSAYAALHTNYPNTTIYNDAGAYMEVQYHTNDSREGLVWIKTGTLSPVEFNALKKNGIQVYPLSAMQYVSGAWTDVTAQSYQNGSWRGWWNGELYILGDVYESVTGGWIGTEEINYEGWGTCLPTVTDNGDSVHIVPSAKSSSVYRASSKIDLTNFDTLYFTGILQNNDGGSNTRLCIWKPHGFDLSDNLAAYIGGSTTGNDTTHTLDISELTGEYYIGFWIRNYYGYVTMRKLWLE